MSTAGDTNAGHSHAHGHGHGSSDQHLYGYGDGNGETGTKPIMANSKTETAYISVAALYIADAIHGNTSRIKHCMACVATSRAYRSQWTTDY